MITSLMPEGRQRYFNNDGTPAAGCKLYTYAAGTLVNKDTYSDSAGTVPNTNPITLDAKGEAVIFWNGAYKVDLKTAAGAQITGYPVDNINTDPAGLWTLVATLLTSVGAAMIGFIQGGVGAGLRTMQAKAREYIHIKDFGASPAASAAVNAAAINAALTYAASLGGEIVHMDGGKYDISATITVPSRCKLVGVSLGYGVYASTVLNWTGGASVSVQMGSGATDGYYSKLQGFALKNSGTGTVGILLRATRLEIEDVTVTAATSTGFSDSGIKSDYSGVGTIFTLLFRNVYVYGCSTGIYLRQVNNAILDACFIESNGTGVYIVDSTNVVITNGTVLEAFGPTAGVYPGAETATSACIEAVNVNNLVVRDFYSEVAANNTTGVAIAQRFARLNNVVGGCIESGWIYGDGTSTATYPLIDVQASTVKGLSIKNNNCFRMVANGYIVGASGTGNLAKLEIGNNTHTVNAFEHDNSWTPTLLVNGSAVGVTGSFTGLWERHGSWITVSFAISLTSQGASVGTVTIGNLPLPMQPRLDAGMFIAGTLFMSNCQLQSTAMSMTRITTSGSTIALRYRLVASNNDSAYTDVDIQNTTEFYGSITYPVEP